MIYDERVPRAARRPRTFWLTVGHYVTLEQSDRQTSGCKKRRKKRLGRREKGSADHVRRAGIGGVFSVGRVRVSRTAGHLNAEESQESARHHGKWRVAVESALFRVARR